MVWVSNIMNPVNGVKMGSLKNESLARGAKEQRSHVKVSFDSSPKNLLISVLIYASTFFDGQHGSVCNYIYNHILLCMIFGCLIAST